MRYVPAVDTHGMPSHSSNATLAGQKAAVSLAALASSSAASRESVAITSVRGTLMCRTYLTCSRVKFDVLTKTPEPSA